MNKNNNKLSVRKIVFNENSLMSKEHEKEDH